MNKLLITFWISIMTLGLQAQVINIPKSNIQKLEYLGDTSIILGTIPSNTGQIDSFGYVTTTFPSFIASDGFITMQQVDNLWNNRAYKNNEIIGDIIYKPNNQKQFAALRNRKGIAMFQKVRIYKRSYSEKSNPQKFWYLYEYMINNNIPNETFWNHPQVDTLLNWGEYFPAPIDTTVIDTTQ